VVIKQKISLLSEMKHKHVFKISGHQANCCCQPRLGMRILIIGGTRFVGLAIAEEALSRGHSVTVFHRGQTNCGDIASAERIQGDRNSDLSGLSGDQSWDATIDVCGYRPNQIDRLHAALGTRAGRMIYISTVSVYAEDIPHNSNESGPLVSTTSLAGADTDQIPIDGSTYGPLKLLCEKRVEAIYNDALIIRPTYVIGPHDYTMRFPKWVKLISKGGQVDCPSPESNAVQFIDARDQAAFVVSLIERGVSGIFHTVAPSTSFKGMLDAIVDAVGGLGVSLRWIPPEDVLLRKSEFPMWSGEKSEGMLAMDGSAAVSAGLTIRPLSETIRDTLTWLISQPEYNA
jgi:2'-hydroxyisoflavone reductase